MGHILKPGMQLGNRLARRTKPKTITHMEYGHFVLHSNTDGGWSER